MAAATSSGSPMRLKACMAVEALSAASLPARAGRAGNRARGRWERSGAVLAHALALQAHGPAAHTATQPCCQAAPARLLRAPHVWLRCCQPCALLGRAHPHL